MRALIRAAREVLGRRGREECHRRDRYFKGEEVGTGEGAVIVRT